MQQLPRSSRAYRQHSSRSSSSSSSSCSSSVSQHYLVCAITHRTAQGRSRTRTRASLRQAGPTIAAPDYTDIEGQPLNKVVMALFRRKMVNAIGSDSELQGYDAIINLTGKLNSKFTEARQVQLTTRGILKSLFPSWLPGAFKVMFSKPLPELSCRMNALATAVSCQWLMGPCTVNDVELDDGTIGKGMGVLVERCRYLEQSGCASICINSCKVPTQEFFEKDMGLPLTMTPNYDDFSCQFAFGKTPLPQHLDEAFTTPCFQQCPSRTARYTDVNRQTPADSSNCTNILKAESQPVTKSAAQSSAA